MQALSMMNEIAIFPYNILQGKCRLSEKRRVFSEDSRPLCKRLKLTGVSGFLMFQFIHLTTGGMGSVVPM
jgi:hypothetical protein